MATFLPPHRDPSAWESVIFVGAKNATVRLPPRDGIGEVTVSLPSGLKTSKAKSSGKNGAVVSKHGANDAKVTIVFRFAAQHWDIVKAALDAIDPRGPSAGGPFRMTCPNLPSGFDAVQIKEIAPMGTACIKGGVGEVTITGDETTFPKSGTGTGASGKAPAKKPLSDFERAAIESAIRLLEQRIKNDAALIQSSATETELQAASNNLAELRKEATRLQKQLDDIPIPKATQTSTPTSPGDPVGRTVTNPNGTTASNQGYTSANPAAPTGAP